MTDTLVDRLVRAGASRVLTPDDDDFASELSAFNLAFRYAPDVVVAAANVADVESAIRVAEHSGASIRAVGLGHGVMHDFAGGIAVTTRGLAGVAVDVDARTARVGAGSTWAQVLEAVTPYGLAALCGSAPGVGVTGYTLGGGIGPVARTFGFTADHVRAVEIVTPADGLVTATAHTRPDLFWALRGGKGGFGIVTAITIDLFPLTAVYGGGIYFPAAAGRAVVSAFDGWCSTLPDTVTASLALLRLPQVPDLPDAIRGRFVVHLRFAALEDASVAERLLAPMRALATPLLDTVGVLPYSAIGSIHSDPVTPLAATEGGITLDSFGSDAVDALLAAAGPDVDAPLAAVEVRALGGAIALEPQIANAVGGRSSRYVLHVVSAPVPSLIDTVLHRAVGDVLAAMEPWRAPTLLINFVGRSNRPGAETQAWSREENERLDAIRLAADPGGMFPFGGHTGAG